MPAPSKAILNWRASTLALACALPAAHALAADITPSGPAVPENLLRIELRLDAPLSAPLDMQRVALFDANGAQIPDALLDLPLPSRDGLGLTLLLHPGRIKTGVGPNVALGLALQAGQTVTLKIDDPQLGAPLQRRWLVGAALRQPLDPQSWQLHLPRAGSRAPLRVAMPAALDGAGAGLIAVAGPDGQRLAGKAVLADGETEWRFTPSSRWRAGNYLLRIHPSLEDPQGNRICSAFEQAAQSREACRDEGTQAFKIF
jgi:hypothetical protein